jgi:hypothetical protein
MNVKELYCLNDDRANFRTVEGKDDENIFGYKTLKDLLERTMAEAEVTQIPPRAVILGQNGLGKTLHLRYLESMIKKSGKPFYPVRLKVGSYEAKSRINLLHNRMLHAFRFSEFERRLKEEVKKPTGIAWLEAQQLPDGVDHAVFQLANSKSPVIIDLARRFLSGEALKPADAVTLSITKRCLVEGDDYASIIRLIAELVQLQDKKSILFCLDEFEYVQYVNNQDAFINWKDGLRNLLDVKQAGFIFAIAAQNMEGVAKILRESDIVRRIAINNYHRLPGYKLEDTHRFFTELFHTFINQEKLAAYETEKSLTTNPKYSRETFPFTTDALDGYCRWIHKKDSEAKPSEFEDRLNETAADACLKGKQLIDVDFLKSRTEFREED